jgi:predicted metal-binding membrane protein
MTSAARERARVRTPLLCASVCAWGVMAFAPGSSSPHAGHGHEMHGEHAMDASVSTWATMWVVMLVAMMLPLLGPPIRHVLDRSLAARRARSVALFLAGYVALWLAAGVVLGAMSQVARASAPPLAALAAVLLWQVSPWKQVCLNRLHAHPALAAFGTRADWGALRFGLAHGFWCAGSCWGLMFLPLLVSWGHLPAMLAASLWMWGEQLERASAPSWRWRAPLKAARLVLAQARQRLRALRPATAAFRS